MPRRYFPIYQSRQGARFKFAGVAITLKAGDDAKSDSVTWNLLASSIGNREPEVGAHLQDGNGLWWVVEEVGPLDGGSYPLLCNRRKGE